MYQRKLPKKIICFLIFISTAFSISAKVATSEEMILIDDLITDAKSQQIAKLIVLGSLGKASGLCLYSINGLPGPRVEDNRYRDTVTLVPAGKVYLRAEYKYKKINGGKNNITYNLKPGKTYLTYAKLTKKRWYIELKEVDVSDIENAKKKDKKWMKEVSDLISNGNSERVMVYVTPWREIYQAETEKAKESFISSEVFEEISKQK